MNCLAKSQNGEESEMAVAKHSSEKEGILDLH